MNKYLILIAGSPGTGKSYLIDKMRSALGEFFLLTPDEVKEMFADSIGFRNLKEKAAVETKVWAFYYNVLDLYMEAGKRIIVSEYPFSAKQKVALQTRADKFDYHVITIRLVADFEVLWNRRKIRDRENERHLSHIMTHYHFGDQLENRSDADNLITKEDFKKIITERQYDQFELGRLFEYDVTDFSKVDYTALMEKVKSIIAH